MYTDNILISQETARNKPRTADIDETKNLFYDFNIRVKIPQFYRLSDLLRWRRKIISAALSVENQSSCTYKKNNKKSKPNNSVLIQPQKIKTAFDKIDKSDNAEPGDTSPALFFRFTIVINLTCRKTVSKAIDIRPGSRYNHNIKSNECYYYYHAKGF